ncbi:Tetratricopeptide repeat protein [uncultured archaeon]|nr:Tetratricopeptide repeat protein [uncultured archaeon]
MRKGAHSPNPKSEHHRTNKSGAERDIFSAHHDRHHRSSAIWRGIRWVTLGSAVLVTSFFAARAQDTAVKGGKPAGDSANTAWNWMTKDRDSRLSALDSLLQVDTGNMQALWLRAELLAQGSYEERLDALNNFSSLIRLQPGMADAYYGRARVLSSMGRDREALDDYNQALKLGNNPDSVRDVRFFMAGSLMRLGRADEALQHLGWIIQDQPEWENGAAFVERGFALLQTGRYELALKDFDQLLRMGSQKTVWLQDLDLSQIHYGRGAAWYGLDSYEQAVREFDLAVQLGPKYADAYFARGNAKYALKEYAGALADYNKAVELDPKNAMAFYNRGHALQMLGRTQDANGSFSQAHQLDPKL